MSSTTANANQETESEPRLRDLPRRIENLPRLLPLALIRLYQATDLKRITAGYLPFLSYLLTLWLPGDL